MGENVTKLATEEEAFQALLERRAPDASPELVRLAALARSLETWRPPINPGFRARLRGTLLEEARRGRRIRRLASRADEWRRSLRVVLATGVAVVVLGSSGAVLAAARGALPGQALYGVKRWQERRELLTTFGDGRKGIKLLAMARARLFEVQDLLHAGVARGALYSSTLNDMDAITVEGATRLTRAYAGRHDRGLVERLRGFAEQQWLDLSGLAERLPAEARPQARDSIELASRVGAQARDILAGCPCALENALAPSTAVAGETNASAGARIRCICEHAAAGPQPSAAPKTSKAADGKDGTGGGEPSPEPTPEQPPRFLPDVPGATDDQVDQLIQDLLRSVPTPAPTALPLR